MALSREVKTGLLAVFAIATLILGYNYLKGTNLFKSSKTFYVVYDNVEGLSQASIVTINGLRIGKVEEIRLNQNTGKLVVSFTVDGDYYFSKNSVAKTYGGLIVGGKSIAIIPDYSEKVMAKSGDTLRSEQDGGVIDIVSNQLGPLQTKVESAIVSADSLLLALNQVMDSTKRKELKELISNFNATSSSLKNTSLALENVMVTNKEKLNTTIGNLENASNNFSALSDSLSQIKINTLVKELEYTITNFKEISEKVNRTDGSIGKLINDDKLYNNLEGATRQLEQLLQDVKLNPKRYINVSVFGKKQTEYEKPENRED